VVDVRGLLLATLLIALVIGFAIALYGYMAKEVHVIPWGLIVVGYTFFASVAIGSSIVNSLFTVFHYRRPDGILEKVIKYGVWFSLASIVPAWILVLLDLAKPLEGFFRITFSLALESRIYWMAILYTLFGIFLALELIYMIRSEVSERLRSLKILELTLASLVLLVAVLVKSNLAQVYGTMVSIPGWFGAHLAPLFIASAVLIGASGQAIYITLYKWRDVIVRSATTTLYGWIYILVILLYVFLLGWVIITAWYGPAWISWSEIVKGAYALEFWLVEILLGVIAVLALSAYAVTKRSYTAMLIASILLFITGFASKYSLIVYHQLVTLSPVGTPMRLSYTPGFDEILMIVGAIIAYIALLLLGTLLLPLEQGEKPRRLWIFR
jgi:Ni/Fe-hydrogenase subunit HybB-like protein